MSPNQESSMMADDAALYRPAERKAPPPGAAAKPAQPRSHRPVDQPRVSPR